MKEESLALLLSHELSHYLLDHQPTRIFKSLFVNEIQNKIFKSTKAKEIYDPAREEYKKKSVG